MLWGNSNYNFAYGVTNSESDITDFAKNINNNQYDEGACLLLYFKDSIPSSIKSYDNSLLGYGVYFLDNKKLRFQFFLKNDEKFEIIPELNSEAKYLSSNDVRNIYSVYFNKEEKIYGVAIANKEVLFKSNLSKSHTLGYNIKYLLRKVYGANVNMRPPSECEAPCTGAHQECQNTTHGWSCDYTSDEENDVAQASYLMDEGDLSQPHIDSAYDISLHYLFRDSFLNKYSIGRKYIDYYYRMTASSYLTIDILLNTPSYLIALNEKLNDILTGNHNEILIDNEFKTQTLQLLNYYHDAAPDDEKEFFADIANDVNTYSNKTIAEILEEID